MFEVRVDKFGVLIGFFELRIERLILSLSILDVVIYYILLFTGRWIISRGVRTLVFSLEDL